MRNAEIQREIEDRVGAARLKDECSRFFLQLEATSFARCDVRVSRDGVPYVLEINANCGIYYPPADYGSADLCLTHDPAGHAGFTRNLVEAAFARHARATETPSRSMNSGGDSPERP